ncbi:hypothetical protein GALL_152430 [mine drainage metagenome]|uniref:Uncharacterized protein n=1 Tax=mine drainage metagenome TaxID=410659 RepID=A0A1J5SF09_9ZZZZ
MHTEALNAWSVAGIFALLAAFATGLVSAYFWWKASCVLPRPGGGIDSGEQLIRQEAWLWAQIEQSKTASKLNAIAAGCSAITVFLSVLSSLLSNAQTLAALVAHWFS